MAFSLTLSFFLFCFGCSLWALQRRRWVWACTLSRYLTRLLAGARNEENEYMVNVDYSPCIHSIMTWLRAWERMRINFICIFDRNNNEWKKRDSNSNWKPHKTMKSMHYVHYTITLYMYRLFPKSTDTI